MAFSYTILASILALLTTFFFGFQVGRLREKHGIAAPTMTGADEFERAVRVQANTNEQLILFLPALWMAAYVRGAESDLILGVIGLIWVVARFWYRSKYMAAASRFAPMMVGLLSLLTVVGMTLWAVISGMVM